MNKLFFRRMLLLCMIVLVPLVGVCGCAEKAPEESAALDTAVEGSGSGETETETEKPQIVDQPDRPSSDGQTGGNDSDQPSSGNDSGSDSSGGNDGDGSSGNSSGGNDGSSTDGDQPDTGNDTDADGEEAKTANFTMMSFNIRYTDDPNGHSIVERAPRVKQIVEMYDPDIVGMQEVVPTWKTQLETQLGSQYEILVHYRSTSNPEGLAILYKKDLFTLIEEGSFWLSETPDTESKSWDASLPRICTWARLTHKATGKTILAMCYHGEGTDLFAQNAYNVIETRLLQRYDSDVQFLVGDFNRGPGDAGMASYMGYFEEARTTLSNPTTDSNATTTPAGYPNPGQTGPGLYHFDYLFHQESKAAAVDYIVDTTMIDGYFASDHYAVIATYQI